MRRMARAMPRAIPPRSRHVGAIDGLKPACGAAPIDALRANDRRRADPSLAAPLARMSLRPVRDFVSALRCVGRVAAACPLVFAYAPPISAFAATARFGFAHHTS